MRRALALVLVFSLLPGSVWAVNLGGFPSNSKFLTVRVADGTCGAPSIYGSGAGETTTGLAWATPNLLGCVAGAEVARIGLGQVTLTGGTVTVSTPVLSVVGTWNAGPVPFTGVLFNFTCTACASTSKILDAQLGAVSKFSVQQDGTVTAAGPFLASSGAAGTNLSYAFSAETLLGFYRRKAGAITVTAGGGVGIIELDTASGLLAGSSGLVIGWYSGALGTVFDTYLQRNAAGVLAFGNAAAVQSTMDFSTGTFKFRNSTNVADAPITASAGTFSKAVRTTGYTAVVVTKATNYTISTNDEVILGDATAGAITLTLPAAASYSGLRLHIEKIDAVANNVVIAAAGGDSIEGNASVTLAAQYQSRVLVSDGVNKWYRQSSL